MQTSGPAKQVCVFQPYGIGKRELTDCYVAIQNGRVEVTLKKPSTIINGVEATTLNFPQDICTILW